MPDQKNESNTENNKQTRGKDWILWTLLCVFITLSVAGMWAIDYFYAPEVLAPATLPDAVGK